MALSLVVAVFEDADTEPSIEKTLRILEYHLKRNTIAYNSHRKKRLYQRNICQ